MGGGASVGVERYGFVWVWTGEKSLADPAAIPADLAYLSESGWHFVWGYKAVNGNFMQLKENVLDLTHFAFLHKKSLGITDWDKPPEVEVTPARVTYRQRFEMAPLAPVYASPAGKPPGKLANRVNWGSSLSAGSHHGSVEIHDPHPEPGGLEHFTLRIIHFTTPVSTGKAHYYWAMARDHGAPFDFAQMRSQADIVFGEDIAMVEASQAMAQRSLDHDQAVEFSVAADRAAIEARRRVAAQVAAERSSHHGSVTATHASQGTH